MLRRTVLFLKQTANPPRRRIPLEANPLTWWSRNLPRWKELPKDDPQLDQLTVGLEGCRSAFNATNSVRTCMYFGTQEPPAFLSLKSWKDIAHVQARASDREGQSSEGESVFNDTSSSNGNSDAEGNGGGEQWDDIALFGESPFLSQLNTMRPIVALENFTPRSENVLTRRFPFQSRLVVGHENQGVSDRYLFGRGCDGSGTAGATDSEDTMGNGTATKADSVIYIPHYGTISSLNVVTSMGIALFYAYLDQHFPASRTLPGDGKQPIATKRELSAAEEALKLYQIRFQDALPTGPASEMRVCEKAQRDPEGNQKPRVDTRPLHPNYFKKDIAGILDSHSTYRQTLLEYSNAWTREVAQASSADEHQLVPRTRFGISLLYENEFDQRNFGGLIRNANAFLVDKVCYLGRRKFNVVGSVGTYHYTPPVYLGPTFQQSCDPNYRPSSADEEEDGDGECGVEAPTVLQQRTSQYESIIRGVIDEGRANSDGKSAGALSDHQERIMKLSMWSLSLRSQVEEVCGGRTRFWLLDCGHHQRYAEDFDVLRQMQKDGVTPTAGDTHQKSSFESLVWYMTHCTDDTFVLSLCDTEEKLSKEAGDGVVLVVPQEGKLPDVTILMQCEKILTVIPDTIVTETGPDARVSVKRGLPPQVASGIALQRLSVALHPCLKSL